MRPIHEQVVDVRSGLQPQGSMIGIITSDPAAQYIRSPSFSTKTGDWMVVLAGPGQLVLAVEFPANSEKYREFSILCPIAGRSRRRVPRKSCRISGNSLANGTGNFVEISAKTLRETGIESSRSCTDHPRHFIHHRPLVLANRSRP